MLQKIREELSRASHFYANDNGRGQMTKPVSSQPKHKWQRILQCIKRRPGNLIRRMLRQPLRERPYRLLIVAHVSKPDFAAHRMNVSRKGAKAQRSKIVYHEGRQR